MLQMALTNKQRFFITMLIYRIMRRKKRRRIADYRRKFVNMLLLSVTTNDLLVSQLQMSILGLLQVSTLQMPSVRRCRAYERHDFWFQDLWDNRHDEDYHGGQRWKRDFRMRVDTFLKLVRKLTPYIQKQDTVR